MFTSTKQTTGNKKMSLPAHLQKIVEKLEAKEEEFKKLGGNPNWYQDALNAAEKKGDDNNLIHAVIPA